MWSNHSLPIDCRLPLCQHDHKVLGAVMIKYFLRESVARHCQSLTPQSSYMLAEAEFDEPYILCTLDNCMGVLGFLSPARVRKRMVHVAWQELKTQAKASYSSIEVDGLPP